MAVLREVADGLRTAWRLRAPFVAVHLAIQLLVAAVVAPAGAFLLGAAIATSDQGALTDQDIAWFLLTPWGLAAALAVGALAIAAAVLDIAAMTAILRARERGVTGALRLALGLVARRFDRLLRFAVLLVLRVALMAAPFAALGGAAIWLAIREHDINYYLTYTPPAFLLASALCAALALGLAAWLVARLSGWAVALHLVLIRRVSPRASFAASADLLHGRRAGIAWRIAAWTAAYLAAGALLAAAAGALLAWVPGLFGAHLRLAAAAGAGLVLLWTLGGTLLAALFSGALADLLNRLFDEVAGQAPPVVDPVADPVPDPVLAPAPRRGLRLGLVAAGAAALAVAGGLAAADRLLDAVATDRPVEVIAHRGAAGSRPENTLASVRKAVEDQADWVEVDVQETADDLVVVAHDSDFMKLGRDPLKVWDATAADIARIDIGSWFDPAWAKERTPLLADVLQEVKGRARLLIELKYYGHDKALEQRVADLVAAAGMEAEVGVMSLKIPGVRKMQALRPDWPAGVLAAKAIGDLSKIEADFVAVNAGQASIGLVRRVHARGRKIYVWTIDDPIAMSRMISMGVDGLITNRPALARQIIAARAELSPAERLMLWLTDRFRIGRFALVADDEDA